MSPVGNGLLSRLTGGKPGVEVSCVIATEKPSWPEVGLCSVLFGRNIMAKPARITGLRCRAVGQADARRKIVAVGIGLIAGIAAGSYVLQSAAQVGQTDL